MYKTQVSLYSTPKKPFAEIKLLATVLICTLLLPLSLFLIFLPFMLLF